MTLGVVIVTGGTRGIGAATTVELLRRGYAVYAAYLSNDDAAAALVEQAREEVPGCAPRLGLHRLDVSSPQDVTYMVECAVEQGPLVGLVNNAGSVEQPASLMEMPLERWQRVFSTNVMGAFLCCREALPRMSTQLGGRGGSIVNVSARQAVTGAPGEQVDFASSKAALECMTVGLAAEAGPLEVRVNAVRPGVISTDFYAHVGDPELPLRSASSTPLGRAGHPAEVAAAIAWLVGDESSYVTGSVIEVAGGRHRP